VVEGGESGRRNLCHAWNGRQSSESQKQSFAEARDEEWPGVAKQQQLAIVDAMTRFAWDTYCFDLNKNKQNKCVKEVSVTSGSHSSQSLQATNTHCMGYLLYIVYMRDVEACSLPCNTQCFADFDLHRPQQVSSQLLEQLGEEDVEPVVDQ